MNYVAVEAEKCIFAMRVLFSFVFEASVCLQEEE